MPANGDDYRGGVERQQYIVNKLDAGRHEVHEKRSALACRDPQYVRGRGPQ